LAKPADVAVYGSVRRRVAELLGVHPRSSMEEGHEGKMGCTLLIRVGQQHK
jgi:hypothetical protein